MTENQTENKEAYQVWFTADLHLRHQNILRYQKGRHKAMGLKDENDIATHDKYIVDKWLATVKRHDHVYVIGDFIMAGTDETRRILHQLKSTGCNLHLIVGNHDSSSLKCPEMFGSIDYIKEVEFKRSAFPFLEDNFRVVMCHYPMVTWPHKTDGALHLFGHVHNNAPWINEGTDGNLSLNAGIDAPIADFGLINLRTVYAWWKERVGDKNPKKYIDDACRRYPHLVR